jgi:hypothetical protein
VTRGNVAKFVTDDDSQMLVSRQQGQHTCSNQNVPLFGKGIHIL